MSLHLRSLALLAATGLAVACKEEPVDADADGTPASADCDDGAASVNPDAVELCDGIDNNCDGQVDEGVTTTWYADTDADGHGDPAAGIEACARPVGTVAVDDDCDDTRADVSPTATEVCDAVDNDCDGDTDEPDALDATLRYLDGDGDGFGDPTDAVPSCEAVSGRVDDGTDCDDAESTAYPGAEEVCDGLDNDCNGEIDEDGALDAPTWYVDADGDGHGVDHYTMVACAPASGFVASPEDCDDTDPAISPDADEVCDGIDNDCDGGIDEGDAVDAPSWYLDADGDGDGDAADAVSSCAPVEGRSATDTDCDDGDGSIYSGAPEYCDGVDHDCDGLVDEDDSVDAVSWHPDGDSDGYGDPASATVACDAPSGTVADDTDCDDGDGTVFPGATETWYDGVDQDCAGDDDHDADADGWRASDTTAAGRDCDDGDAAVNPDAVEVCGNGIDDDCDGSAGACTPMGALGPDDADLVFVGDTASGRAGASVDIAGDLDGDGLDDLLIGAPGAGAGSAMVVYGGVSAGLALSGADTVLTGETAGDAFGSSVRWAGDTNGDGLGDIAVGAPYGAGSAGAVYLFHGPVTGVSSAADAAAFFVGDGADARTGASLAAVGDLDADGALDLLIGAPMAAAGSPSSTGVAWLLLGPVTGVMGTADAIALSGTAAWDGAGAAVAPGGDLDGDGYVDVLVGGAGADLAGSASGVAWVVSGPILTDLDLADADATLAGVSAGDRAGSSVSTAGDVNGDGYDDVLVGAPTADSGAGRAYLVHGPVSGPVSLGSAAAELTAEAAGDAAGTAVATAGDIDVDGFADVLVGAPQHDAALQDVGAVYLVHGPMTGAFALRNADATVQGDAASLGLGSSLAGAGDPDGNGEVDLLLGAPGDASTAPSGGAAFLFLTEGL